jgi:hypothetical protein
MELHFETIMKAAEQQLANEAYQLVQTDHKTAVTLVEIAIDKIANSYSTAQKLTILAGVRDIDELEVEIAALASVRKMTDVVTQMLRTCIKQRLDMVASAINVAVFAEGVLRAADAFIKVAEAATHSERWLPEDKVAAMREAHDHLDAGEGSIDDLRTILTGAALFNGSKLHEERQVAKQLKFYRDLLKPGWPLLATAFDQLNDQRRHDAGLPSEQKAAPSPR